MEELKTQENTLRTLKDLYVGGCGGEYCYLSYSHEDLRAEAIKWAKLARVSCDNAVLERTKEYYNGQLFFIVDFFNIQENELK